MKSPERTFTISIPSEDDLSASVENFLSSLDKIKILYDELSDRVSVLANRLNFNHQQGIREIEDGDYVLKFRVAKSSNKIRILSDDCERSIVELPWREKLEYCEFLGWFLSRLKDPAFIQDLSEVISYGETK